MIFSVSVLQDTDAAYMVKVELETKLDGLSDEIEFLKRIYHAVITSYSICTLMIG